MEANLKRAAARWQKLRFDACRLANFGGQTGSPWLIVSDLAVFDRHFWFHRALLTSILRFTCLPVEGPGMRAGCCTAVGEKQKRRGRRHQIRSSDFSNRAYLIFAPPGVGAAKRGSVKRNSVHSGSERTSESCPPCAIANSRAILKPRP
jgi:hypothetical protein